MWPKETYVVAKIYVFSAMVQQESSVLMLLYRSFVSKSGGPSLVHLLAASACSGLSQLTNRIMGCYSLIMKIEVIVPCLQRHNQSCAAIGV